MQRLIGLFKKTIFNSRRIPVIPPLLIDRKLVSVFKKKPTNSMNFLFVCVHHGTLW